MDMPLYCLHSLFLDAVIKVTVLFPKTHYSKMPCAVLIVKGLFMTVGGKSNLQGKVNNHTPTIRLISVLSMKKNV